MGTSNVVATVLQALGAMLVVGAATVASTSLGLLVAGVFLIAFGLAAER